MLLFTLLRINITQHLLFFIITENFDFSPGSTLAGTNELVYNNKADIVIETEQLKEIMDEYEYTKEQRVVLIEQRLENYLEGVKQ